MERENCPFIYSLIDKMGILISVRVDPAGLVLVSMEIDNYNASADN